MSEPMKHMTVLEFRELGYLHEVNRLLLHRCGVALSVQIEDDGAESFGPIWDCRDDPVGIVFGECDQSKIDLVDREVKKRLVARFQQFGFMVQDRQVVKC